jgi:hypothetical protein
MTTDNFCFYLQNRLIQTSQTGGQGYSDTSPLSIPWLYVLVDIGLPSQTVGYSKRTPLPELILAKV